jgi:hypothetical protein
LRNATSRWKTIVARHGTPAYFSRVNPPPVYIIAGRIVNHTVSARRRWMRNADPDVILPAPSTHARNLEASRRPMIGRAYFTA